MYPYRLSRDEFGAHQKIISKISRGKTVLEIGCATGYIARELVKKGCIVVGVEIDPYKALRARRYCKTVIIGSIEDRSTLSKVKEKFDVLLLADVLEHLKDPLTTLEAITKFLRRDGTVIISVPNVAFLTNRLNLLLGRFEYTNVGIMDRTHLRFFTKKTIIELVLQSGLIVEKFDHVGNFTQLPLYMRILYPFVGKLDWWRSLEYRITGLWPEGLAVQFLLIGRKP